MHMIYPLILCCGMGSRLWPMSRIDQPKQFQPVSGRGSMTYFQTSVQRHRGPQFHDPIVVTNQGHTDLVHQQLGEIQCGGQIIGEPVGRNTGPAVLAAALNVLQSDPAAAMKLALVLLSDPTDAALDHAGARAALTLAAQGTSLSAKVTAPNLLHLLDKPATLATKDAP